MTGVFVYEHFSADPRCARAALASQGRLMRNAMVADLAMLDGVRVTYAVAAAPGEHTVPTSADDASATRSVRQLRRTADELPADFLRRQAESHDLIWVVAPESGGVLSSLRAAVADHQWLGCSQRAIDITSSKRAAAEHLAAAGIATTQPLDPGIAKDVTARHWVVKPDDGCGASNARRHTGYGLACADYASRLLRHEDPVLEPWIDGDPLSVALLCGPGHVEVLAVNRQQISFDATGAISFDGVTIGAITGAQAEATAALAGRVCAALPGLSGFVGIDITWHPDRGPVVIEVNPRVTCAYEGLSALLGGNVAQRVMALHQRTHGETRLRPVRALQQGQ